MTNKSVVQFDGLDRQQKNEQVNSTFLSESPLASNQRKKVVYFGIKYFPSRGGTSRVVENMILQLKNEYDITIYCYKNAQAKNYIEGVNVIQFPEFSFGSFGVFIYYLICFFHLRLFGKYDIIHAHKIDSFLFLNAFTKKSKVIATVHELPYKRDKWNFIAKWFFKINEKQFIKFKGIKTSISKPLSEYYKEQHNLDVEFIQNGINPPTSENSTQIDKFWPKNVPQNTKYVFFAARRIMGTKGLHTMIDAYKRLNYKGNIFVAGEIDNLPSYMKKIQQKSKGLNIYFLGYVHPLTTLLQFVKQSYYFVFPSETEGMSIMLLEVASMGKPIIASDIPENKQIFSDSEVLYFENKNSFDLQKKIEWAENNKMDFMNVGKSAQKKVLEDYTWDKIVNKYRELYNQ